MTSGEPWPVIELNRYSTVLFDVDGTVVVGSTPTPGAPEFVAACRRAGLQIGFITNASMRTPAELITMLRAQGWDSLLTLTGTTTADAARSWADTEGAPTYVVPCLADAIVRA